MAKKDDSRFVVVHKDTMMDSGGGEAIRIIVDRLTGVQYLSDRYGPGNGLTVLVDQDGKPLLYQPPSE